MYFGFATDPYLVKVCTNCWLKRDTKFIAAITALGTRVGIAEAYASTQYRAAVATMFGPTGVVIGGVPDGIIGG